MEQRKIGKLSQFPQDVDSPISYAVAGRDKAVLEMVTQAVAHKEVLLAFQPVV